MSTTHNYLTKRLGILRAQAATSENQIAALGKQHAAELAELAEVEAALAAVDALTEPPMPTPDEDDEIAAEIDAAEDAEEEETDRG